MAVTDTTIIRKRTVTKNACKYCKRAVRYAQDWQVGEKKGPKLFFMVEMIGARDGNNGSCF